PVRRRLGRPRPRRRVLADPRTLHGRAVVGVPRRPPAGGGVVVLRPVGPGGAGRAGPRRAQGADGAQRRDGGGDGGEGPARPGTAAGGARGVPEPAARGGAVPLRGR